MVTLIDDDHDKNNDTKDDNDDEYDKDDDHNQWSMINVNNRWSTMMNMTTGSNQLYVSCFMLASIAHILCIPKHQHPTITMIIITIWLDDEDDEDGDEDGDQDEQTWYDMWAWWHW